MQENKTRIVIFASGSGSNAREIIHYFANHSTIEVALVLSNNRFAGVHEIAKQSNIPSIVLNREAINNKDQVMHVLDSWHIDFIILAGFMLLLPTFIIEAYPDKVLNIHPALLPKFGGPGMYGHHVHQAVKEANEATSGITIHIVNENYDEGKVIFQASCNLDTNMNAFDISKKVLALEHKYYASQIEKYIHEFGSN